MIPKLTSYSDLFEVSARALRTSMSRDTAYMDILLQEGRLSLLLEEFTSDDAKKLATAITTTINLSVMISSALPESMKATKEYLKSLSAEAKDVSNTAEIAKLSIAGKTDAMKKKLIEINSVVTKIGNISAAVVQTMITAADNLEEINFEDIVSDKNEIDDLKKMTFSEFDTSLKNKGDARKYKPIVDILKAIMNSFAIPDWQTSAIEKGVSDAKSNAGGLWGSIKNFFGSLFKKAKESLDPGKKAFVEDMKMLSISDIISVKEKMEEIKGKIIPATERSSEVSAESTTSAATTSKTASRADTTGNTAVGERESPETLKRNDWQKMASDQPDEFVKRINAAAKTNILESKRWIQLAGIKV